MPRFLSVMSRPMALVLVIMILFLTSQSDWKQQEQSDDDVSASFSSKQQKNVNRTELIKEQIILSQERKINLLNELVRTLQQHIAECKRGNVDNSSQAAPVYTVEQHSKESLEVN